MKRQLLIKQSEIEMDENETLRMDNGADIPGKSTTEKQIFKIYQNVKDVGTQIKEDLLDDGAYIREKKSIYEFALTSDTTESGVLDRAYGIFLLANLLDGFGATFKPKEKERLKNSIVQLLKYVEKNGYDVSPYASREENQHIFREGEVSFIESLTWCFSCFMYAHKLHKSSESDFDFTEELELLDSILARGLEILVNNAIRKTPNGYELGWKEGESDYVGWGAVTGSKQVSLYFTQSVCETYGDMEDTILGNDELNIARDHEYISRLNTLVGYDIIQRFVTICQCVGKNVYQKYKEKLGEKFFYEDGSEATKSQIEYSTQSPALLNQLYVVMIPIYTNYNVILSKENPEEFNVFQIKIKEAVDMVYKEYSDLLAKEKDGIVNRDYVTFFGLFDDKKKAAMLTKERINVAILEALIVRARALIVTYVTKYPEKELGEMIGIIEKNLISEDKWIWGDLQETERCVSALKEFYDYYKDYESTYANMTADRKQLAADHAREIKEESEKLRSEHKKETQKLKMQYEEEIQALNEKIAELQDAVNNGSPIETEIRKYIEENVVKNVDEILMERFNKLAAANADKNLALNETELQLQNALSNYVKSYFVDAIALAKKEDGHPEFRNKTEDEILAAAKLCMDYFLREFLPFAMLNEANEDVVDIFRYLRKNSGIINGLTNKK